MGEPMAASLLRAGFAVTVCAHRNHEPVQRLVALGAHDGGDPAGVAAGGGRAPRGGGRAPPAPAAGSTSRPISGRKRWSARST
ncbi:MAG: hypothetical protein NVS3B7_13810 [Candidatus Elarobacter sp.]